MTGIDRSRRFLFKNVLIGTVSSRKDYILVCTLFILYIQKKVIDTTLAKPMTICQGYMNIIVVNHSTPKLTNPGN